LDPQERDSPTPYDLIGGDGGVKALVERYGHPMLRAALDSAFGKTADWMRNR
jgi:truncated hemoglobin YjbI